MIRGRHERVHAITARRSRGGGKRAGDFIRTLRGGADKRESPTSRHPRKARKDNKHRESTRAPRRRVLSRPEVRVFFARLADSGSFSPKRARARVESVVRIPHTPLNFFLLRGKSRRARSGAVSRDNARRRYPRIASQAGQHHRTRSSPRSLDVTFTFLLPGQRSGSQEESVSPLTQNAFIPRDTLRGYVRNSRQRRNNNARGGRTRHVYNDSRFSIGESFRRDDSRRMPGNAEPPRTLRRGCKRKSRRVLACTPA